MPGPLDIEPCLAAAADGIRGALETCERAGAGSSRSSSGRATSRSRSGDHYVETLPTATGAWRFRGPGRSSSTTRTTGRSRGSASRRSTTQRPASRRRPSCNASARGGRHLGAGPRRARGRLRLFLKLNIGPGAEQGPRPSHRVTTTGHRLAPSHACVRDDPVRLGVLLEGVRRARSCACTVNCRFALGELPRTPMAPGATGCRSSG